MTTPRKETTMTTWGPQKASGSVQVSGAKNAATRMLAAATLTNEAVTLTNFPTELLDARAKGAHLEKLGARVLFDANKSEVKVDCANLCDRELPDYQLPIRTTYLLAAGLLARGGIAHIPYPGGCKLGDRKIDLHLMVWRRFGAKVEELADCIRLTAPKLQPTEVDFPITTVGGTENALLCAAVCEGDSLIKNAYVTPEVESLIQMLRGMGAEISETDAGNLLVRGSSNLRGSTVRVMADRIEALTWIVFGAIAGGQVTVRGVPFADMEIPLIHLRAAGVKYVQRDDTLVVTAASNRSALRPFEVACGTHPGIISDMQPFYVLLALAANGRSLIVDYRYPERVAYVEQLARMAGAALTWENGRIRVNGPVRLQGAEVKSTDLRGSMALLLAAMLAEGPSRIANIEMALRGYDGLADKLRGLGLSFELS